LGLDLGTTSVGWAFVHEAENESEETKIIKLGVRISQLDNFDKVDQKGNVSESKNPINDFASGKGLSPNAGRTQKRGARRNLQRFKLRRDNLIEVLKQNRVINEDFVPAEIGKNSTFRTLEIRAKAALEKISKDDFARVLLTINKKRGYKSSRKAQNEDEGQAIDGMAVAKRLYEENLTPGQLCLNLLNNGKKSLPDFYRSDLNNEFDRVWNYQRQFYPAVLNDEFYKNVQGQGLQNTRKLFYSKHKIYTAENKGTRDHKKLQAYMWRSKAISERLDISEVAFVLCEINNDLNKSSGYLGAISDRSKELYFNNETVGQYLYKQINSNPHSRLKGQVFYRQDYLDEYERIWEIQKQFHPELTEELKEELRDIIIFYQRKLKSQKGLISYCEFESYDKVITVEDKSKIIKIGAKVAPRSSMLFQEFKIWQILSNIKFKNKISKEEFILDLKTKQQLFDELNINGSRKAEEVVKILGLDVKEWELNYSVIEGNHTNKALYDAYIAMFELAGHEIDRNKLSAIEIRDTIRKFFTLSGIKTKLLEFDALIDGQEFEIQDSYQLWHLLYSYEGDDSKTGNETLYELLNVKYGFNREQAKILANVTFLDDYGDLSSKAIRKIMPFIQENGYSEACKLAGYNHSSAVTKDENLKRELKEKLELLPKNSLRNPVVEKILNQVVNVVNAIIRDPGMGRPDEIRIELARELKKNAKERAELTLGINKAKEEHEKIRKLLKSEFGILNPTRNDIIRYKLYQELEPNGYKTLYTETYINREKLFSKEFDIEHIIPKARLFDDSFSNKTIEKRQANIDKGDDTAYDYIYREFGEKACSDYSTRVEYLYKSGKIGKAKFQKLLKKGNEIGEGFIERDLRESQYIAKKAKELLLEISRSVVSTTGSITDRLREDWGLINTLQELNFEKYKAVGLIESVVSKDGAIKERIVDWSKRNDHRHHAMDALTVAFTKSSIIQYLNYLNARKNENHKLHSNIIAIEQKVTIKEEKGKRVFKAPMNNFRKEAKLQLENILISFKAKNKVVTRNRNKIKGSSIVQIVNTPRGQMHKETVYGKSNYYDTNYIKVGPSCNEKTLSKVANKKYREALLNRLNEFDNDPKKAFGGKNSLAKNPVYFAKDGMVPEKVMIVNLAEKYTIRKDVDSELVVDKIVDHKVRRILRDRLETFGNDPKRAFTDLDKNPIWLNEEKGISIKRVTISGVSNAEALHFKKDHLGNYIFDSMGNKIPVDFVSTGKNHHVAIYQDEEGNLHEEVVSFYEAVARVNEGVPIIKKNHENGWKFLFTMKQNEMFVFPSPDFVPSEIDLLNPDNYHLISPHLFRVQTISVVKYGNNTIRDFKFKHHLETSSTEDKSLKGITYHQIKSLEPLISIVKVRINHLGKIVSFGEY
ncbi:MAG: type II CRISPR RNA-guided endonuclease Cas9, partial [Weeksellaceae bacterium]|nr:type II CRISPR RNA-guided endonuclease Cas9 [Weeksellaceae bacterium]